MNKPNSISRPKKDQFKDFYYCERPIQYDNLHVVIKLSEPRLLFRFSEYGYRNFKEFRTDCHMEWLDSPAAKTDHPTLPISDISTQKYQHETLLKECYAFIIYFTEKTNIVEDFDLFGDEPYKEDDWDFDEEVEAFANVGMHYENAKIREILAECEKRKSGVDFEESQYNMDQSV